MPLSEDTLTPGNPSKIIRQDKIRRIRTSQLILSVVGWLRQNTRARDRHSYLATAALTLLAVGGGVEDIVDDGRKFSAREKLEGREVENVRRADQFS